MSEFETDISTYTTGAASIATVGAAVAFGLLYGAINRNIMINRTNAARQLIADRIRRDRVERRRLEVEVAIARCDAALARYHLRRRAQGLRSTEVRR